MVEWFQKVLGDEWKIKPAGGLTGDAFFAEKENRRLFLKRNSSPFLAVLSAEGIVPKLVWTKRMDNGDVVTAQEWLAGRALRPEEMQHPRVADLLHKIHHSTELLHMLLRLGKQPITSEDHLKELKNRLNQLIEINQNTEVIKAIQYLYQYFPVTKSEKQVVCHGDIDHHNLLLTDDNQLFLIDWDNAMISDPMTDYGMVLLSYLPQDNWDSWLSRYGIERDEHFLKRLYWYLILDTLKFIAWHYERNEPNRMKERLDLLKKVNNQVSSVIPLDLKR
ncbi:phosphotransferase family protein [Ornithinibacillus halophilus]|uniref:Thiamine kinase n=1 Tax=Ornithinibacillus halophilus TaxID=930117 RepID=A0A1M5EMJ2_9BACI|nr:phosphotransferase family protein [Ornithinibacillus halophilus]SHF80508.1 Thiamine kinase [Ornithinibacillus halophilus]